MSKYTRQYKTEIIREMEFEIAKANQEQLSVSMSNFEIQELTNNASAEAIAIGEDIIRMIDEELSIDSV